MLWKSISLVSDEELNGVYKALSPEEMVGDMEFEWTDLEGASQSNEESDF
jgi:hypothetical protein